MAGVHLLHATAGRLRIKAAVLQHEPTRAATLLEQLRTLAGVSHVEINPVTRNVIILYEPHRVSQIALCAQLESLFGGPVRTCQTTSSRTGGVELRAHLARALVKSAMEAAVQRAVLALI